MNTTVKPSTIADQPPHRSGEAVDLTCLDMSISINRTHGESSAPVISMNQKKIRNARMDGNGVGYEFDFPSGKSWKKCMLSRRQFGVDNFSLDNESVIRFSQCPEEKKGPDFLVVDMRMSARVWCWEKDIDHAQSALMTAAKKALKLLNGACSDIEFELDEGPVIDPESPQKTNKAKP